MKVCKRCQVSGRVQGVFYRASTAEQARRLGVTGYAENLSDGRVEVLACGEEEVVQEFIGWLKRGPPAAKVEGVEIESLEYREAPADFSTR